jgi:hypothetical protein
MPISMNTNVGESVAVSMMLSLPGTKSGKRLTRSDEPKGAPTMQRAKTFALAVIEGTNSSSHIGRALHNPGRHWPIK